MDALPIGTENATSRSGSRIPWGRIGISLAVAGCLAGIVWGVSLAETDPTAGYPAEVEAVYPEPGSPVVPAQSSLEADLLANYEGVISFDGREIPKDQIIYTRATGQLIFRPGADQEYDVLPGGRHTAAVTFWPATGTRERDGKVYTWTFTVL